MKSEALMRLIKFADPKGLFHLEGPLWEELLLRVAKQGHYLECGHGLPFQGEEEIDIDEWEPDLEQWRGVDGCEFCADIISVEQASDKTTREL